ncbi:type II toxin-antitoxin system PemK/MazF family toxin [Marinomonas sp. GJ51-6]|uniref:type II toxin-antitoxin system PemK/MazF family toxin n=1 Tax=Marinomonas sp. GJ51-6 TaxID=2992802 RepID=UPI002934D38F|nr:type II toxin-antitoxin system PemK/MazF family toxin [Marinomonas sp. GJ51-6]WOD07455.1 type II toxin-antitoxin system PemK/MazF family toxin [Marinomonas sp. GJ51-6]
MKTAYVPDRKDIVWLDFDLKKGKEIGKLRPALVLSSKALNSKTGMIICLPISTSIRGGALEVSLADDLNKPSVVVSNAPQTLDWKHRKAQFITQANDQVYNEAVLKLATLMGIDQILDDMEE